MNFALIII